MDDRTRHVGQISSLIPQVFYDIIGRIVPGMILLILAFLLFRAQDWQVSTEGVRFGALHFSYGCLFVVGLLLSYLVGTILGAVGYLAAHHEWSETAEGQKAEVPDSGRPEAARYDSYIYDAIQLCEPAAGARLVKLSAERNLCRVLMAGFALLGILCLALPEFSRTHGSYGPLIVALLGFGLWGAYLFHKHLAIRSQRLMLNLWFVLVEEGRAKVTPAGKASRRGRGPETQRRGQKVRGPEAGLAGVDRAEKRTRTVYNVVASVGIAVAAIWATFVFRATGQGQPCLAMTHKCEHFWQSDGRVLLRVYVALENRGTGPYDSKGKKLRVCVNDLLPWRTALGSIEPDPNDRLKTSVDFPDHSKTASAAFALLGSAYSDDPIRLGPQELDELYFHFLLDGQTRAVSIASTLPKEDEDQRRPKNPGDKKLPKRTYSAYVIAGS